LSASSEVRDFTSSDSFQIPFPISYLVISNVIESRMIPDFTVADSVSDLIKIMSELASRSRFWGRRFHRMLPFISGISYHFDNLLLGNFSQNIASLVQCFLKILLLAFGYFSLQGFSDRLALVNSMFLYLLFGFGVGTLLGPSTFPNFNGQRFHFFYPRRLIN
jgi:hypothetical protein